MTKGKVKTSTNQIKINLKSCKEFTIFFEIFTCQFLFILREGVQKIINYLARIHQMNMGRIGYYKENGIIINHIYIWVN